MPSKFIIPGEETSPTLRKNPTGEK